MPPAAFNLLGAKLYSFASSWKYRREEKNHRKIASVALFAHGSVEVLAVMMPFALAELLPTGFQEEPVSWAVMSATYGVSMVSALFRLCLLLLFR